MSDIQTWKEGTTGEPKFPDDFDILKKAVLQVTDIKTNRNKYYAIELHSSKKKFRVYTHYGRTDDLDSNPNAGARESRYCDNVSEAEAIYNKILKEKTSSKKGYKELSLASSKIGSRKTIGQSSGTVDEKTLAKIVSVTSVITATPSISKDIQEIVQYLYSEATNALTSTVNATITANGIETPLGVLTIGQIDKGQIVLDEIAEAFGKKKKVQDVLTQLSGDFYTLIPHKFGRSREQAQSAVIDTADKINDKQDTLQLMRDMLNINGKNNVLVNPEFEQKYKALNCTIETLSASKFKEIKDYVEKSVVRGGRVKVKNIWCIQRDKEYQDFNKKIDNKQLLFHGSSAKNWVGILSRGLLLPKIVVTLGVNRTDAGWLGNGIYFGNAACTAMNYAGSGRRSTSFMTVAEVALGKVKDYTKITYGLKGPPDGFDSCHGVRGSQFSDDEFVIYEHNQQRLQYLVEVF